MKSLLEGGELGYDQYGDVNFATYVMHSNAWKDEGGGEPVGRQGSERSSFMGSGRGTFAKDDSNKWPSAIHDIQGESSSGTSCEDALSHGAE